MYSNYTDRNDPKFSDRQAWANSADSDQTAPKEQSDQGLHCLQFPLHLLDALLYGKTILFIFRVITANFRVSEIIGVLRYCIQLREKIKNNYTGQVSVCSIQTFACI